MRTLPIALCLVVSSVIPASAEDSSPRITVKAQSEIRVAPDEAIIEFSIETRDAKSFRPAKQQNDLLTSKAVKIVRDQGFPEDSFRVIRMQADRDSPYFNEREYFTVDRSFELRTPDFTKIEPIIGGLLDLSDTEVHIEAMDLQVRDQRKHQMEARRLAVEYAHEKATHLASLNHRKLGQAITITENVEYNDNAGGFGGMGGAMSQSIEPSGRRGRGLDDKDSKNPLVRLVHLDEPVKIEESPADDAAATREILLSPGQVTLNARVEITYELLPE
jgi:uncharacterized protein YggE